jgi:response regulator of citrate/malate metabolism
MSDLWEVVEQEPRYPLPKTTVKYRDHLRGYARLALDEMVKLYRKSPNKPVAITARQFAKLCGVSRATAQRSINSLIDAGFIALERAAFGMNRRGIPESARF